MQIRRVFVESAWPGEVPRGSRPVHAFLSVEGLPWLVAEVDPESREVTWSASGPGEHVAVPLDTRTTRDDPAFQLGYGIETALRALVALGDRISRIDEVLVVLGLPPRINPDDTASVLLGLAVRCRP